MATEKPNDRLVVEQDQDQQWYLSRKAANNHTRWTSEGHTSEEDAWRAAWKSAPDIAEQYAPGNTNPDGSPGSVQTPLDQATFPPDAQLDSPPQPEQETPTAAFKHPSLNEPGRYAQGQDDGGRQAEREQRAAEAVDRDDPTDHPIYHREWDDSDYEAADRAAEFQRLADEAVGGAYTGSPHGNLPEPQPEPGSDPFAPVD